LIRRKEVVGGKKVVRFDKKRKKKIKGDRT